MSIDQKTELHIEETLNKIRVIYVEAATRIDALKPGEKIPATKLAEELAKENGMTGPSLYPTLLFLIKEYPGVEVRRGAHGGIVKLPVKDNSLTIQPVTVP